MLKFGLITEGKTDQLVIKTIILTLLGNESARTVELCPMQDEPSGYTKVFTYVNDEKLKTFLEDDECYAVIHLDTDTTGLWPEFFQNNAKVDNFLKEIVAVGGAKKGNEQNLINAIVSLLRQIIGEKYCEDFNDKIIYAISVNDIECWVLPFHATKKSDLNKLVNCLSSINQILKRSGAGYSIDPTAKHKLYPRLIEEMKDKKVLLSKYHHNESLKVFVERILTYDTAVGDL